MPNNTQELGLKIAVDNDDTADYLEIYLGGSLTTIDGLFSQVSGHTHSGAHQGGPINGNAFSGSLDIPDWYRSTGHRSAFSTTGAGAEMYYDGTSAVFQGYDRGGSVYRPLLLRGSTVSVGPAAALTSIDASGNVTMPAALTVAGLITGNSGMNTTTVQCSTIGCSGNATVSGGLSAGPTSLSGDLQLNNHNINGLSTINGSPTISGTLTCNGNINTNAFSCTTINTNGQTITCGAINASGQVQATQLRATNGNLYINTRRVYDGGDGVHVDWDFRVDSGHDVFTHDIHIVASSGDCHISSSSGQMDYFGPNGSTNHRFFHIDTSWMGCQAANFSQQSSAASKLDVKPVAEPLAIVQHPNLHGVTYKHVLDPTGPDRVGFVADEWLNVFPSLVVTDAEGKAETMDYGSLGAITFEAVRQLADLVATLTARIDALEAKGATA